jgi:16S rRNA (cytidine1402-2'-O)-methyltransferase
VHSTAAPGREQKTGPAIKSRSGEELHAGRQSWQDAPAATLGGTEDGLEIPHPGTLYVVATPIGHLSDMTFRAVRILREVALIACEDTRRTARLLQAHEIATPMTSFFEHNERWKGERILRALREGRDVALVSDAGTPGISDPGFRLVREARAEGLAVVPVPGASAAVAALSVSGLPTDRFLFVGFLPARTHARREALSDLAKQRETLVVYEAPTRVVASLADMLEIWGNRDAFLCREATKVHEEYVRASLSALHDTLAARAEVKGEIVLVVEGAPEPTAAEGDAETLYAALAAEGLTRRQAVKETARRLGLPAREVYRRVLGEET